MRMAMNLVSGLLKIPKTSPKYYVYVNIRRPHEPIDRGHLRSRLQLEKCSKVTVPSLTQIRKIRVTEPNRALHPIILLLLRPVSKIITIISGRLIRKWWRKLPPEEKQKIWNRIRGKRKVIAGIGCFVFIIFILYYYDHVIESPLTKRKRFIIIGEDAMMKIAQLIFQLEIDKFKSEIVPPRHPFYQRAARVADAIIRANKDLPEVRKIQWSLVVIDKPNITNAVCLADGKILVFTGILNVCTNDDQLAIVLSHEISHTILAHANENLSKVYLVSGILLIPSFICWIIFTDLWALMSEWVTSYLANILINLPFSRYLEREADRVGLILAARACFDVREALPFWAKMEVIEASYEPVELLSTHPTSKTRQEDIKNILPAALEVRSKSRCPELRRTTSKYYWW